MNFFTITKLGRAVVLAAALAVGAASAGDALFYNPGGGAGGSELARLKYDGKVLGQSNNTSDYGSQPDFYFALKLFDVANYGTWGLNGDFVFIRDNGRFHGIDLGIGFGVGKMSGSEMSVSMDFGLGYSYGVELCFDNNLQLLLGGSAGFWMGAEMTGENVNSDDQSTNMDAHYDFFGPFVRVHWHSIELMYRLLMGFNIKGSGLEDANSAELEMGFGATHRISLGYCFGKNPK